MDGQIPIVFLKPGREKSLLRRHPWIYSGAIDHIQHSDESLLPDQIEQGSTVWINDWKGNFLAQGAWSGRSQIRIRVWSFDKRKVDKKFFLERIQRSIELRKLLRVSEVRTAYRVVHAESDGIPGLIADMYNDGIVLQFLTAGIEKWKNEIVEAFQELCRPRFIFERSDADVRELEGLKSIQGVLYGDSPSKLVISEYNTQFWVDLVHGHKTGFYLDQAENRWWIGQCCRDRDVLNCFAYTGGFTIHALANRAKSVVSVDSSEDALNLLEENLQLNGLDSSIHQTIKGDVFQVLRQFRDTHRSFDVIILDPPKLAPTSAHVERAARGYKDLNLLAFKLLRPHGILFTFSCSGGIDRLLFQKIVADAALDAGAQVSIVRQFTQGGDHPINVYFPEGAYLKGLMCVKQ